MASSPAFEWLCDALERHSSLDRLQSRGTIRLALRASGLGVDDVTPDQLAVVLQQVLPGELMSRAVEDARALCERLASELADARIDGGASRAAPEDVFRRLAEG